MTVLTDTQVVTASGGLVELGYSQITGPVAIGTSVTQLIPATGSLTCVCDGSPVIVDVFYPYISTTSGANTRIGITVDGVQNQLGIYSPNAFVPGKFSYRLTPSAGSHTFSAYAFADIAGTAGAGGGGGSGAYVPAFLRVSKIVQATQWPAVTTGTIICTSSTRPASPFAGQQIYETDTSRNYQWNGTAWVSPQMMAKVRLTSDFGAPYVSATPITWQSDTTPGFDTDTMWASGNATKLIPTVAGVYVFTFSCQWTYTGTMSTSAARILLNSNVIGRQAVFAAQTAELDYSVSAVAKMNGTTDFVTADLFYSGTPTFVTLKAVEATYLSGHYIGPTP